MICKSIRWGRLSNALNLSVEPSIKRWRPIRFIIEPRYLMLRSRKRQLISWSMIWEMHLKWIWPWSTSSISITTSLRSQALSILPSGFYQAALSWCWLLLLPAQSCRITSSSPRLSWSCAGCIFRFMIKGREMRPWFWVRQLSVLLFSWTWASWTKSRCSSDYSEEFSCSPSSRWQDFQSKSRLFWTMFWSSSLKFASSTFLRWWSIGPTRNIFSSPIRKRTSTSSSELLWICSLIQSFSFRMRN